MIATATRSRSVLFGVPIDAVSMPEAVALCRHAVVTRSQMLIGVVNAAKIVSMRHQPLLRESVLKAHIVVADGMAVVWASRLLRRPLPERVAGIDLFENLLDLAHRDNFSVYLLGATQEVLERLVIKVEQRWPGLRVAGMQDGYFNEEESKAVADRITASNADMLFVGITSPKKEMFLARFADQLQVPVCHGVGGSFDVFSGKTKRAPRLWQRTGFEWFYRVCQEPTRLWKRYLVTNTIFIYLVLRELLRAGDSMATSSDPAASM